MTSLEEKENKYGSVIYEGEKFILTEDADYTSRVFPGGWRDASDGETYFAEFSAHAISPSGDDARVYWMFDAVRGEEPEDLSNYHWDDEHVSRVEIY